jgi:hypothetical protein
MSLTWQTVQNLLFPAATVSPQILRKSSDGILEAYGKEVPVDGTGGFVPGCRFVHIDGSGRNDVLFINGGTAISCNFDTIRYLPDQYGTTSGRGPSPAIWANCPVLDYVANPELGSHYFEDFKGDVFGAAGAVNYNSGLAFFGDTGVLHRGLITDHRGVLQVIDSDTDNDDSAMAYGHNGGVMKLTANKKFWFEARVSRDTVADNELAFFVGLAEEGLCAADSLDVDTGEFVTGKDVLGFLQKLDDGNAIDLIHGDGTGEVVEKAVGIAVPTSGAFNKLGLYGDGTTVTPYVDGVPTTDTILYAAADMPLGEEMAIYLFTKNGDVGNSDHIGSIDWWRLAVEY